MLSYGNDSTELCQYFTLCNLKIVLVQSNESKRGVRLVRDLRGAYDQSNQFSALQTTDELIIRHNKTL